MAASYAYDPLGRRQTKTANGVVTTFLSDGDEEIAEYDGAATLLRRYVPGPATDVPIAMVTPSGGSNTHSYFHANRQGSIVAMSADNGTMSEGPYTYDAYGNGAPAIGVPYKYTGRRLDPETGLYYYRARYYSAALGRFLQTDPIGYGDQMNLYGYVGNDPTNATDPTGLFAPPPPPHPIVVVVVVVVVVCALIPSCWDFFVGPSDKKDDKTAPTATGRGKNRLPATGPPGTTETNKPGTAQRRYGPDGQPEQDWNDGHPGAPPPEDKPHVHDHTPNPQNPTGKPTREDGRPPDRPGDLTGPSQPTPPPSEPPPDEPPRPTPTDPPSPKP